RGVLSDGSGVLVGVGGEFAFGRGDIDPLQEVEGQRLHFLQVVVVGPERLEFRLPPVEDLRDPPSDVHFPFHLDVLERLFPEPLLPQRAGATGDGTRGRALREDAINT
ncbi:MAG: hypothetical protein Q9214_008067, partial [Letrouitia sp. 1 TL-2023]